MAEVIWNPKPPTETVAYSDDWTAELNGDTIASFTFVRSTGTAVIESTAIAGATITYLISGGVDAETATFLTTVTTTAGQVLERNFTLSIVAGADSFQPTSTTKRQLVGQMFVECTLAGWEYDLDPAELDTALNRLDMLMWELRGRGIEVGYNFPAGIGQGDLDDDLGCPDQAFYGLAVLGAERLCPTMGKTQSKESRIALNAAMKAVRSAAIVLVPSMRLARGTPLGSGGKPQTLYYPFAS